MSQKKNIHVDLCVIGGGAAGLSVAAGAAQMGFDVALVEKNKMGGDCLNTGCIPSKSLLAAAKAAQTFRKAEIFGIKSAEPEIDFAAVNDYVRHVIKTIEPHDSPERFEAMGVKVVRGEACFTGPHCLRADDMKITARYFVIATGSRAVLPPISGLDAKKALTNETIFNLREKPDHLIIIGGGPIGMEMAQAHRRLGCSVTILDIATVMPKDDPELAAIVRGALEEEGVRIIEKTNIRRIEHGEDGVAVRMEKEGKESILRGTRLLIAAGRAPNVEDMGLEKAGVQYDKKGIKTDARLRTSQKHIYAAGDVAGGPQFTHIAGYHAGIIIKNILFKIPAKTDYAALPWVTYTDPELAQAGLTEAAAKEKYGDRIKSVSWKFKENDRAQTERRTEGMIKVVTMKNGRIIGASAAGPSAGDLIGLWALAISQKMKIGAVAGMIAPYPTFGEISKRAAGAFFTPSLFSDKTRKIVGFLHKLPL